MAEHPSFRRPLTPPGEPVAGKTYRRDGWQIVDTPLMLANFWQELIDVIGADHHVLLTSSRHERADGSYRRASMLISPTGQQRIAAAAA